MKQYDDAEDNCVSLRTVSPKQLSSGRTIIWWNGGRWLFLVGILGVPADTFTTY